jgi:GT2 family glycosyltransferase
MMSIGEFCWSGLLRIQSILCDTRPSAITRALECFDNAARVARETGAVQRVEIAYGDCSPRPLLAPGELQALRCRFANLHEINFTHFGANLGHAAGQNQLTESAAGDLVLFADPEILVCPTLFGELIGALGRAGVGLVEGRQLPIEHPKYYDPQTGETSWASTTCALAPVNLVRQIGGFDAETFFNYGGDVDFSWRLRLAGFTVVHQCSAVVFSNKRLANDGALPAGGAERYYSAEAALLLSYKYSREDVTETYLETFVSSGDEFLIKAARSFQRRSKIQDLPTPIDKDHVVAEFIDGSFGPSRYKCL